MMRYLRRFLRIYQGFVVSGAIIIFGVTAFFLAVLPGIKATRDLYGNLKDVQKEVQALSGKFAFLQSLSEDDLRNRLMTMLSAVPAEKSIPTIFSSADGLANKSGVSIIDMNLMGMGSLATGAAVRQSAAEKKIGAGTLAFTMNATGSYDQIRSFVSEINKVRRLFDVTSFDLTIGSTGATQVRLSLAAFYQPIPTNVGMVQSPVIALTTKEEEVFMKVSQYPDVSQTFLEALAPDFSGGKRNPFAR